jgi:DNA mismatch repair ATPase MutS
MAAGQDDVTPMMRQYRRIIGELPEGVVLLFRLGDFYELFFEDARRAAPILSVALAGALADCSAAAATEGDDCGGDRLSE